MPPIMPVKTAILGGKHLKKQVAVEWAFVGKHVVSPGEELFLQIIAIFSSLSKEELSI